MMLDSHLCLGNAETGSSSKNHLANILKTRLSCCILPTMQMVISLAKKRIDPGKSCQEF